MSSRDYQTLNIQRNLVSGAVEQAMQAIQKTGRALPCTVVEVDGPLVTVKFEAQMPITQLDGSQSQVTLPNIQIPKAQSQYAFEPTQIGDVGITLPADTFLGGITGQGAGVADLSVDYGNLSTLVWVPVAAKSFSNSPDANKFWLNGPGGVELSDTARAITLIIDQASATIQLAGAGMASDNGLVRKSDLQAAINAVVSTLVTWAHTNLQAGTSAALAPTNPTATGSTKTFTA